MPRSPEPVLGRRYQGERVQRRAGPHRGAWLGPQRVGFASLLWRARRVGPRIGIAVAPSGDRELSGEADVLEGSFASNRGETMASRMKTIESAKWSLVVVKK